VFPGIRDLLILAFRNTMPLEGIYLPSGGHTDPALRNGDVTGTGEADA
jgi:hypothetical protein